MPLEPDVHPIIVPTACVVGLENVGQQLGVKLDQIATLAGCHPNTVGPALKGARKQFLKAHGVFTAINIISGDGFERFQHVHYYDEIADDFRFDEALKQCAAIPAAKKILSDHSWTAARLAEEANVRLIEARQIVEMRFPVARNVVTAIARVLARLEPEAPIQIVR